MISSAIAEAIGIIGGALIISSYIPQIIKSAKTKKVEDVSIWMIIATLVGTLFWIAYGIIILSLSVILSNSVFLIFIIFQLILMIKYGKKRI